MLLCALMCLGAPVTASVRAPVLPPMAGNAIPSVPAPEPPPPLTRSGRDIYTTFRDGLAQRECPADTSDRWRRHFSHVPGDLAEQPDTLLPLFGYVVEALRTHHLPTEYALIPFVESGYRPGARSASGPAGLWQFITATARNHQVAIRPGYDGRLSPVESTRAAVRYLRTLHGMFAGDWRLAVMGYNAGEYRIFGALRQAGQQAMTADPGSLQVPAITQAYVRKLQALSCLLLEAGEDSDWLAAIDQAVPYLAEAPLPAGTTHLDGWAAGHGLDAGLVRRFNPAFPDGRVSRGTRDLHVLVPRGLSTAAAQASLAGGPPLPAAPMAAEAASPAATPPAAAPATGTRTHTVGRGESIWRIARRYGVGSAQLLLRNGLSSDAVLHPGMVLMIDERVGGEGGAVAH